eukprot:5679344-Pyramimonas_sp.AAC.1
MDRPMRSNDNFMAPIGPLADFRLSLPPRGRPEKTAREGVLESPNLIGPDLLRITIDWENSSMPARVAFQNEEGRETSHGGRRL